MFPLERSIKGRTAEAIATIIFERGGYRLARFGIEELFREVKLLNVEQYEELKLDLRLRSLPDFLVSTPELNMAYQVEVKFRNSLATERRTELARKIKEQRQHWPSTYILLLVGQSPFREDAEFFQDYVRVIPPEFPIEEIAMDRPSDQFWNTLPEVGKVFPLIRRSDFRLDKVVPFIRQLNRIGPEKEN